jgi:hypothetical protein
MSRCPRPQTSPFRRSKQPRNASRPRQSFAPKPCLPGYRCSSTAMSAARTSTYGLRASTGRSQRNFAREALSGWLRPLCRGRNQSATFRSGLNILQYFRSCWAPLPRRHSRDAPMPIGAPPAGVGSVGFRASPIASPSSANSDGLFPFVRLISHTDSYTRPLLLFMKRSLGGIKRKSKSERCAGSRLLFLRKGEAGPYRSNGFERRPNMRIDRLRRTSPSVSRLMRTA